MKQDEGICTDSIHTEHNGKPCACVNCYPIGFCANHPCEMCEGPVKERCKLGED